MIDLAALRANVAKVRACAPQQRIIAVVKADAYGHGAVTVAQAIETTVDAFAVCCLEEALILRDAGIQLPIVLLEGFFHADELPIIAAQNIQIALHASPQVELLLKNPQATPLNVWLKVDTGMHRLGFLPQYVSAVWKLLQPAEHIAKPIRVMSHLACADERQNPYTKQQVQRFSEVVRHLGGTETSLANSAGVLAWTQTHGDWVRPGIMLYGVSPFAETVAKAEGLQPVMHLCSVLISVKQYRQGDSIGYGASWRCPQSMPVGVIPVGYADGYPRHAPSGTPVLVNGRRVPLIGRVSMDMLMVDLRSQPNAKAGDPAVLWGRSLPIEEIASHANTIAYELLTKVTPRVKRVVSA
jgi:alanine racemase